MNRSRMLGFTLTELVVVMVIIGVLAVAALPRLNSQVFDSRGFSDQTLAALRYAQKSAIAQRRTVCVAFSATTVTLTMATVPGSTTCSSNLAGPSGTPFQITARSGVAYVASPSNFRFNAAGQASLGQTLQVGGVPSLITVEQETGYVHP